MVGNKKVQRQPVKTIVEAGEYDAAGQSVWVCFPLRGGE